MNLLNSIVYSTVDNKIKDKIKSTVDPSILESIIKPIQQNELTPIEQVIRIISKEKYDELHEKYIKHINGLEQRFIKNFDTDPRNIYTFFMGTCSVFIKGELLHNMIDHETNTYKFNESELLFALCKYYNNTNLINAIQPIKDYASYIDIEGEMKFYVKSIDGVDANGKPIITTIKDDIDVKGQTILMILCKNYRHSNLIDLINIFKDKVDINHKNSSGENAFNHICFYYNHPNILDILPIFMDNINEQSIAELCQSFKCNHADLHCHNLEYWYFDNKNTQKEINSNETSIFNPLYYRYNDASNKKYYCSYYKFSRLECSERIYLMILNFINVLKNTKIIVDDFNDFNIMFAVSANGSLDIFHKLKLIRYLKTLGYKTSFKPSSNPYYCGFSVLNWFIFEYNYMYNFHNNEEIINLFYEFKDDLFGVDRRNQTALFTLCRDTILFSKDITRFINPLKKTKYIGDCIKRTPLTEICKTSLFYKIEDDKWFYNKNHKN